MTDQNSSETLIRLACQLAEELDRSDPVRTDEDTTIELAEKRLVRLQKYGLLWKHVNRALKTRSPKNLEIKVLQNQGKFLIATFCPCTKV
jgi:hypothetical protein